MLSGCGAETNSATIPRDFKTPEGAILCLEDAYRAGDIEAAVGCKDFRMEALLMLQGLEHDFSADEEIVTKTAEVLELSFRKEIETNGFPDFSELESSFSNTASYKDHDDVVVVTEVCTFPDGGTSTQRILVAKTDAGWKVLNPVD